MPSTCPQGWLLIVMNGPCPVNSDNVSSISASSKPTSYFIPISFSTAEAKSGPFTTLFLSYRSFTLSTDRNRMRALERAFPAFPLNIGEILSSSSIPRSGILSNTLFLSEYHPFTHTEIHNSRNAKCCKIAYYNIPSKQELKQEKKAHLQQECHRT